MSISKYNNYYFLAGLSLWAIVLILKKARATSGKWLLFVGFILIIPYSIEKIGKRFAH